MGQLKHRYWTCDARANLATKFKFESDLRKKSFFFKWRMITNFCKDFSKLNNLAFFHF
jgi:hypothetical protein